MAGDLNLKKSWHPGLMRNQEAVWKKEREALEERKKIKERQKEIQRERERDELLAMEEKATGVKRVKRLEWMYSGNNSNSKDDAEAEAYLLGKKRISFANTGDQHEDDFSKLSKESQRFEKIAENKNGDFVVNSKDITSKLREDPLFSIKQKQVNQAQEHVQIKDKDRYKRRRDDSEHRRYERRRYDRDEYGRDEYGTSSRHYGRDRHEYGSRHRDDHDRPYSSKYDRDERGYRPRYDRERVRRPRDDRKYDERTSGSHDRSHDRDERHYRDEHEYRRHDARDSDSRRRSPSPERFSKRDGSEERSKRLAAMMANADSLERTREVRIERSRLEDQQQQQEDEHARDISSRSFGGTGQFARQHGRKMLEA